MSKLNHFQHRKLSIHCEFGISQETNDDKNERTV